MTEITINNTNINSKRSTKTVDVNNSYIKNISGGLESAKNKIENARRGYVELFRKQLSKGLIIIGKPETFAVSEGIGFGGLIFSADNSRASQDTYWQLYKARNAYFIIPSGVMAWKVDETGKQTGKGSASDGDQDWIASEIAVYNKMKSGEWKLPKGLSLGSFKAQIQKDLNAFWDNHIKKVNGRYLFLITNASWAQRGDRRDLYYPNYTDPHFLRSFAKFDTTHDWTKLVNDVQELNQKVLINHNKLGAIGQNPMPAKVFVKIDRRGNYIVENYYAISKREGVSGTDVVDNEADSIRFLLRQGRAAILDNDPVAKQMLAAIVRIAGIKGSSSAHLYTGSNGAPSKWGWSNTLARAGYGIAVLASGNIARAEEFFCSVMRDHKGTYFGEWDGAKNYYYDQSIILQILDTVFQ